MEFQYLEVALQNGWVASIGPIFPLPPTGTLRKLEVK